VYGAQYCTSDAGIVGWHCLLRFYRHQRWSRPFTLRPP